MSKFKDNYGETFPTFWQDLIKWQGWKVVRREYLLYQENGGKFTSTMLDTATATATSTVVNKQEEPSEEVQIQQTRGGDVNGEMREMTMVREHVSHVGPTPTPNRLAVTL